MSEEKTIKKFFQNSDVLKWVIVGLAGFIVLILVFGAGMKVGTLKARYSYRWAENYHRNFAGPRSGFFSDWGNSPRGEFINAHGVFGLIIKIDGNTIITKGRDDVEKTVLVSENTLIQKGRETVKLFDLKPDESVVIIGSPNEEGRIEAKFIRVLPASGSIMPVKEMRKI
ncbi:hypothetical protein A2833_00845 [Candidatus Azambacteria bacterium RIFCSPHIGHO2_01_FULL_44_55]|uniref:DUF5666 domain-containing protein n=1 Tax=Candidatus Azambacteria bacterium RIFCSPLOWO2_02_FULL_44_14 TaxID=1797306 RepID=A0A1F5CA60_9BACT|nr:MAG: hypothetical protein A3C78_03580 [Candidatus Azambacteria bacterium RIFCSPHIGHO2_02_FULL_45_18]OGD39723.1 MAG: hypothetical protein A3I30_00625 [Candidatus Azambacteria bacterium RIFCSPLOWO2_02_FULL_44_14]OGD41662.1 MAG: hypothetical protein A2833_00845 [Candidatus Azambacteria bacterium RIFCSPHIGHO2_01_FULL_44_55]OGD49772.1 MAG: hypothetical protein A2608_02475 [Candidatus Azambacteria bacterium RIFOXYD1_FULL_44_10]